MEQDARPDEAFLTERAIKTGRANASSGRIRVTVPNDHFGPITAEHDPENKVVSRDSVPWSIASCGCEVLTAHALIILQHSK